MDSHLDRQNAHNYDDDDDDHTAGVISGVKDEGDQQHNEKKSVLKKVKEKAKKLKDTLKSHGHGGHEDDEMEEDLPVHASPRAIGIDAPAHHAVNLDKPDAMGAPTVPGVISSDANLDKPAAIGEDPYSIPSNERPLGSRYASGLPRTEKPSAVGEDPYSLQSNEPPFGSRYVSGLPRTEKPSAVGEEGDRYYEPILGSRYESGLSTGLEPEKSNRPPLTGIPEKRVLDPGSEGMHQQRAKLGDLEDFEDAQDPTGVSNYQTKSVDHTGKGGHDADVASLIHAFEKTGVHGESGETTKSFHGESAPKVTESGESGVHGESVPKVTESFEKMGIHDTSASAGSHDQFAPESFSADKSRNQADSIPKAYGWSKPEFLPHDTTETKSSDQGSYVGKIASAVPSVITDKAISAKDVVASKLGYGDAEPPKTKPEHLYTTEPKPSDDQGSYIGKIASAVPSVITDKAISAKNVVASKMGYGDTKDAEPPTTKAEHLYTTESVEPPRTKSEHLYTTEPMPSDQGSYIGKIAAVPPVITAKVISAKNAVASKIGYGGTNEGEPPRNEPEDLHHCTTEPKSSDQGSYIGKIASKIGYGGTNEAEPPRSEPKHLQHYTTEPKSSDQGSYIGKIASAVPSIITDKAISAKNAVASKVGYGGTNDPEPLRTEPEHLHHVTNEPKSSEQGSYIGKIAAVPSVIIDTARSAKNAVASKVGYGGTNDPEPMRTEPEHLHHVTSEPKSSDQGSYIGKIAAVPSAITDTAISAKNAVVSKVGYGGTSETELPRAEDITGATKPPLSTETGDKGTSVKEYLYEKFRPGEEEKALSPEISDALHIKKDNSPRTEMSDVLHVRKDNSPRTRKRTEADPRTTGKVVESTTVLMEPRVVSEAKRDGDGVKGVGHEGSNKGVVDMVKDTVSSWVGKGGHQQHTQAGGAEVPMTGKTGHFQTEGKSMD